MAELKGGTTIGGYEAWHKGNFNKPTNFGGNFDKSILEESIDLNTVLTIGESRFVQAGSSNTPINTVGYVWNVAGGDVANRGVQFFTELTTGRTWMREMTNKIWKEFNFIENDIYAAKYITSTTFTAQRNLVITDNGKKLELNSTSLTNLVIPVSTDSSFGGVFFPTGTQIFFKSLNTGQIQFVPNGGVTINSAGNKYKTKERYSIAQLIYEGANIWSLFGDLVL